MIQIIIDSTVRIIIYLKDFAGAYVDPSTMTMSVLNPSGTEALNKALGDLVKDAVGKYHYDYDTAVDAPPGTWTVNVKAVISGLDEKGRGLFSIVA